MSDRHTQGAEKPTGHEQEWTEVVLGDVLTHRDERGSNDDMLLSLMGGGRGIVPHAYSGRRDTSNKDKSKYRRVNVGDVVYNTMRMWQGVSGVSDYAGIVSPAYTVCEPTARVSAAYLAHALRDPRLVQIFRERSQGLVSDTWNLRYSEFARIPLRIPPLNEQEQIATILDIVDDQLRESERAIAKLELVYEGLRRDLLRVGDHGNWRSSDWEISDLGGSLNGIESGKSPDCPNEAATAGKRGVLKVSSITSQGFLEQENKALPTEVSLSPRFQVRQGDVLMTRANTPDLVGVATVVDQEPYTSLFLCDKTWRLLPGPRLLGEFLAEILCSLPSRRFIQAMATGTSGSMKNISKSSVCRMLIPLPPLAAQHQIVGALGALRDRARSERSVLAGMQALKSGLVADLLSGHVRVFSEKVAS